MARRSLSLTVCWSVRFSGRFSRHQRPTVGFHLPGFRGPDLVDGLAEVSHDVEAVDDVQGLTGRLGNDPQVRLPEITADEAKPGGALLAKLFSSRRSHRCRWSRPHDTAILTERKTLSHEVWKTTAVSFQESRLAQRAKNQA